MISTRLELQATLKMLRQENFNPDLLQGLIERAERILQIIDGHSERSAAIAASPDYTSKGKAAQLAQLSIRSADLLNAEKSKAKDYAAQISILENKVKAKQSPPQDAVLQYLQEREIRDLLKQTKGLDLRVIYMEAGEKGNDLIQTAIENAPIPLLPADVTDAGKQARALRLDPETAAKVSDLQTVKKVFDDIVKSASAELGIADETLSRIATGEAA